MSKMADSSTPIIEFALMNLKPEATIYEEGTEAYRTWRDLAQMVRRAPGCIQNYSGRHMEDPTLGVHILGMCVCVYDPSTYLSLTTPFHPPFSSFFPLAWKPPRRRKKEKKKKKNKKRKPPTDLFPGSEE